ncbi:M-phase inducer phosphatase-like [Mytilus galloprovincialis]|uniref:M-phase inducer phosphatase-like n=1 Tax=Mytilus galloprovincialis TaxID=29158 RepID=UPI003F7CB22C
MPVKRLFSSLSDEDISTILPTFGKRAFSALEENTDTPSSPVLQDSWLSLDSDDSGLGLDEVFLDDSCVNIPPPKRQKTVCDANSVLAGDTNLIADGSSCYSLPTVPGKHKDLKSISPETLTDVLCGRYSDVISSFRVIDCRYPYEYDGGHIKSAENRYLHSMIEDLLHQTSVQVLIFHCEFSQERGPAMLRHLRSKDRQMNTENYPALNYPEIYLLDSGYKSFFGTSSDLCDPIDYRPMLHSDFSADLHHYRRVADVRHFRSKSKSWSSGDRTSRLSRKVIF